MKKNNVILRKILALYIISIVLICVQVLPVHAATPKVKTITWSNVKSQIYIPVKSSKKLKVNISPSKAKKRKLKWYSSKKSIASVTSSGKVYGKKIGKATITCKVSSQPKKKVKCKVYVVKPSKTIVLNTDSVTLMEGQTYQKSARISPATATVKTILYTSSNPNIASIDSKGLVTARSEGTATITARAKDGFAKTKSFKVYVRKSLKDQAKFVAHRGLSSEAPENTIKAYQLAGEAGFWGAETDVRKTKDGNYILMHDDTLKRLCGIDSSPEDMTLDEIKSAKIIDGNNYEKYQNDTNATTIATLEEYLQTCKQYKIVPVIELKMNYNWEEEPEEVEETKESDIQTQSFETASVEKPTEELSQLEEEILEDTDGMVPEATDAHGMLLQSVAEDDLTDLYLKTKEIMGDSKVVFIGFDLQAILKLCEIIEEKGGDSSVQLQHLVNNIDVTDLQLYQKYGIGLDAYHKKADKNTIQTVKNAGIDLNLWTVNDYNMIQEYVNQKVSYITTDYKWW